MAIFCWYTESMAFNARLGKEVFGLTPDELALFKRLSTPVKIQDYLDTLAINFEKKGPTNMSPRSVIREQKAHCFEGAMLAAVALWLHAGPNDSGPMILDMRVQGTDCHCITLYKRNGLWGAISKTNHAALRFRDPVYASVRELVMSYFHEAWDDATGKKNLRGWAGPFDLRNYRPECHPFAKRQKVSKSATKNSWGHDWVTSDADCNLIEDDIRYVPTISLFDGLFSNKKNKNAKKQSNNLKILRKPDKFEMITGTMTEWKREDPRT